MSTLLSDVYDEFWSKIERESVISGLRADEKSEELFQIYKTAAVHFTYARFDLYDINETIETVNAGDIDEFDMVVREFNNIVLTHEELSIMGYLMALVWLERKVMEEDFYGVMGLTTSDFKQLSKSSHLNGIIKTIEAYRKSVDILKDSYSRRKRSGGTITTFISEMSDS